VNALDKKLLLILILLTIINIAFAGVPDSDLDGVSNQNDKCDDSKTTVVDRDGCSCRQKTALECSVNCCVEDTNPCTQLCGENAGQAVCNLLDYECAKELEKEQSKKSDIKTGQAYEPPENEKEILSPEELEKREMLENKIIKEEVIEKQEKTDIIEDRKQTTGQAYKSKNLKELFSKDSNTIVKTVIWIVIILFALFIGVFLFLYLEKRRKRMIPLKGYLKQNLAKGYSIDSLKQELQKQGWNSKEIGKTYDVILKEK